MPVQDNLIMGPVSIGVNLGHPIHVHFVWLGFELGEIGCGVPLRDANGLDSDHNYD